MDLGLRYQLDCPTPEQSWPVHAGKGPGHPIVGYYKHGDVIQATPGMDGWLELPRGQGFVKQMDTERIRFLLAQQSGYRQTVEEAAGDDEDAVGGQSSKSAFGWHQVLVADGLQMVPLTRLQDRVLANMHWCNTCDGSLFATNTTYAMVLGCGHAFHPHCAAGWPSPNLCPTCLLKCLPATTPLPAPAAPAAPPAATLHFSALPPRTHRRLLLTLLTLASLALLRLNHALLATTATYTLLPARTALTYLLSAALHALCRTPHHILRSPLHLYHLLAYLLSTLLATPGALLRALYHTPSFACHALLCTYRFTVPPFYTLSVRTPALVETLLSHDHWAQRYADACAAVLAFWDGYWHWLLHACQRQWLPLAALQPYLPAPLTALVADTWGQAVQWAGQGMERAQVVVDAGWWQERSPLVAAAVGLGQEWVADWGPGSTVACGVAVLAVVGLCVAGRRVKI